MKNPLKHISDAIFKAQHDRPYGLYDYSNYQRAAPYVVMDEKSQEVLYRTQDEKAARDYYETISQRYVAIAAIRAMLEVADVKWKKLAPEEGIEPSLAVLEAAALPLNYTGT